MNMGRSIAETLIAENYLSWVNKISTFYSDQTKKGR